MKGLLDLLRDGKVPAAEEALNAWLATGPSSDEHDLLLLEMLGLEDIPVYRKAAPAGRLRWFLRRLEERYVSSDTEIDWAQTRLQHALGLIEATQIGCDVLLAYLKRMPQRIEAHRLYLDSLAEHEFYVDLGYAERFTELRCHNSERVEILLLWARAEYSSFYTCTSMTEFAREHYTKAVIELIRRAQDIEPMLTWRDVMPVYASQTQGQSEDEALDSSFCVAALRELCKNMSR